jgi:hypothetical protein
MHAKCNPSGINENEAGDEDFQSSDWANFLVLAITVSINLVTSHFLWYSCRKLGY